MWPRKPKNSRMWISQATSVAMVTWGIPEIDSPVSLSLTYDDP